MHSTSFSIQDLHSFQYPKENRYFLLALVVCVPAVLLVLALTFLSMGAVLLFLVFLVFIFWLFHQIGKTYLIANSVRVSPNNFPEIYSIVEDVRARLAYSKSVTVFIVAEGNINAFVASFFKIRYIILNSGLTEEMLQKQKIKQLEWIIGRFIGALKTKQLQTEILEFIVGGIENLKFLNLFIYPYERATQYSGDNYGLMINGDLHATLSAFDKFFVGNKLSSKIQLAGLLEQTAETNDSFLATILRWISPYPHLVQRYLNILAFAHTFVPTQYQLFLQTLDDSTQMYLRQVLPIDYQHRRPMRTYGRQANAYSTDISNNTGDTSSRNRIKIQRRQ